MIEEKNKQIFLGEDKWNDVWNSRQRKDITSYLDAHGMRSLYGVRKTVVH